MKKAIFVLMALLMAGTISCKAHGSPSLESQIKYLGAGDKLCFTTNGNFCGSRYTETLALYSYKSTTGPEVDSTLCILSEQISNKIITTINIPYGSADFDLDKVHDYRIGQGYRSMGLESLGRKIPCGRIGDFLGLGIDQLYFYESSGMSFLPCFFAFDGKEFKDILTDSHDTFPNYTYVAKIDIKNKILTFSDRFEGPEKGRKYFAYKWNSTKFVFERLP
jgi:hypothetical protein